MIFFEGLRAPIARVFLDDGGLRVSWPNANRYVPFESIRDASVDFGLFRVALLRLLARDGQTITLRVLHDEALALQSDIVGHLGGAQVAVGEAVSSALARGARPLLDWLQSVARWAAGGYRTAALEHATAATTLMDAHAPIELRAALAHAMLATGDETDLAAVARAFAHRALPPLVVIAARLGRGGAALVPDAMRDDALELLSEDDAREARRAMAAPVTHEDEAHVHAIMERVKVAAIAEAQAKRAREHHARPKRHHAPALGGYAAQQGVTRFK